MKCKLSTVVLLILLPVSCQVRNQSSLPTATPLGFNGPLPSFIFRLLVPGPQEVISLETYHNGYHYPSDAHPPPGGAKSSICAYIDPSPLLEPGDDDYPANRVKVLVDGTEVDMFDTYFRMTGEILLFDDTGQTVATAGGPLVLCWVASLGSGTHTAMITAEKTSGETMSYNWSFELTDK